MILNRSAETALCELQYFAFPNTRFKKKEEICESMFHISSWNKYNIKKHEYEFNENIFNLFSCVLNDCKHYKHKKTNDLFNIELNRSRINYNNIKNNIKVIGDYDYFAI